MRAAITGGSSSLFTITQAPRVFSIAVLSTPRSVVALYHTKAATGAYEVAPRLQREIVSCRSHGNTMCCIRWQPYHNIDTEVRLQCYHVSRLHACRRSSLQPAIDGAPTVSQVRGPWLRHCLLLHTRYLVDELLFCSSALLAARVWNRMLMSRL